MNRAQRWITYGAAYVLAERAYRWVKSFEPKQQKSPEMRVFEALKSLSTRDHFERPPKLKDIAFEAGISNGTCLRTLYMIGARPVEDVYARWDSRWALPPRRP